MIVATSSRSEAEGLGGLSPLARDRGDENAVWVGSRSAAGELSRCAGALPVPRAPSGRPGDRDTGVGQPLVFTSGVAHPLTVAEVLVRPSRTGRLDATGSAIRDVEVADQPFPAYTPVRQARLRAGTGSPMPDCCVFLAAHDTAASDERLIRGAEELGPVALRARGPRPSWRCASPGVRGATRHMRTHTGQLRIPDATCESSVPSSCVDGGAERRHLLHSSTTHAVAGDVSSPIAGTVTALPACFRANPGLLVVHDAGRGQEPFEVVVCEDA